MFKLAYCYSKAIKYSLEDEERAFHQAIHENPQDTTPVGAYADWLDEHNRPGEAAIFRAAAQDYDSRLQYEKDTRGTTSRPVIRLFNSPNIKHTYVGYTHPTIKNTRNLILSFIPSLFDPTKEFYVSAWHPTQDEAKTVLHNLRNEGHLLHGVDVNNPDAGPLDIADEEKTARVSELPRLPR